MRYSNIRTAEFIHRPNRFIAHVLLDGEEVICHVKNTGRLKELLLPGATVFLEEYDNPARKTRFDLVACCVAMKWSISTVRHQTVRRLRFWNGCFRRGRSDPR